MIDRMVDIANEKGIYINEFDWDDILLRNLFYISFIDNNKQILWSCNLVF